MHSALFITKVAVAGRYGPMTGFLSNIRIQATLVMSTTFAGGFRLEITATVTLAIDLDPGDNGVGGADHAVLLDLLATPIIKGPPCYLPDGPPTFQLGGIKFAASVYWKVLAQGVLKASLAIMPGLDANPACQFAHSRSLRTPMTSRFSWVYLSPSVPQSFSIPSRFVAKGSRDL
jgi:hypothetical protein